MQIKMRTFAGLRPGGAPTHSEAVGASLHRQGNRGWNGQTHQDI